MKPLTTTKLKAIVGVLAAMLVVAMFQIAGHRPPAIVIDALEDLTDVEIECDDAGNCSVAIREGSSDTEAIEDEGSAEGSGE
jgi:hypothetical protein